MAKKEYQSPKMKVSNLYQEDVLTVSVEFASIGGKATSVGSFSEGWLKSGN